MDIIKNNTLELGTDAASAVHNGQPVGGSELKCMADALVELRRLLEGIHRVMINDGPAADNYQDISDLLDDAGFGSRWRGHRYVIINEDEVYQGY